MNFFESSGKLLNYMVADLVKEGPARYVVATQMSYQDRLVFGQQIKDHLPQVRVFCPVPGLGGDFFEDLHGWSSALPDQCPILIVHKGVILQGLSLVNPDAQRHTLVMHALCRMSEAEQIQYLARGCRYGANYEVVPGMSVEPWTADALIAI